MKKLVIVTDGSRLRGFRLSDRQSGRDLCLHCTEIELGSEEVAGSAGDPAAALAELAGQIRDLVEREDAALWNLAAPRDLLNPLVTRLPAGATSRLTRTHACNLVDTSLTEIALRFPPTPCQSARTAAARSATRTP